MKTFMSICLDKNGKSPIYKQLGDALLGLISDGVLAPDTKLPPIRKMAECLKINSSTVVSAYRYLESRHAVYSFLGSGTYVSPHNGSVHKKIREHRQPTPCPIAETDVLVDFVSFKPPDAFFPTKDVAAAASAAIEKYKGDFFAASGRQTEPQLSGVFMERLKGSGISSGHAFLVTGITDALDLVCQTLVKKGDFVVLENPSRYIITGQYTLHGANVLYAPLLTDGIDLEALEVLFKTYRPKAAHFSTYFQTPTNAVYSLQNKKLVIELCYKYGVTIVEEDHFSGLSQDRAVFLKSLDYRGAAVFIKNVTRLEFPWLNAYLCVFSGKLAASAQKKLQSQRVTEQCMQIKILSELLVSGTYDETAQKLIALRRKTYNQLADIIENELSEIAEFERRDSGTGIWLSLQNNFANALAQSCAAKGVLLTPGSIYSSDSGNSIRLCATNASIDKMREGVRVIKAELTKLTL